MYDLQDEFQCLVEGSITQDKWRQEVAAAFSAYHLHKLKESVNGAVKINDVVKTSVSHLYLNVAPKYASFLFRLRAGDLELAIETGRHKGLARGERTCPLCEGGEVEDAVHFCLRCPLSLRHATRYLRRLKRLSSLGALSSAGGAKVLATRLQSRANPQKQFCFGIL